MDSSTHLAHYTLYAEVTANQQRGKRYFQCARLELKYWNSVSTFWALLHFQYLSFEEIVYFSMDWKTDLAHYIRFTEVTANQQREKRYFHCQRLESKYWISLSTFRALLHFQYHSCEEIVYFSMDSILESAQYTLYAEVTANQQKGKRYFQCAKLESTYWNSVSTFGVPLHFQYHSCEEIVYFSMDWKTDLAQYIRFTEVTANQQRDKRYFHCARLESKLWDSVSSFGALLHFQYHSCEEIVYYSMDSKPELIQYILYAEVTANQHREWYFHCARLESKYWYLVSTFRALLHFQDHSCEEIVYFSMDWKTDLAQYIRFTEVTANQQREKRYFHCQRLESKYWISISTFRALLHFQYHSCEEIVYFSMDSILESAQYTLYAEVTANQQRGKRYFQCARLESTYWNSVSTFGVPLHFQYHSCEEIVYFSMDWKTDLAQYIRFTEVTANQQREKRYFHCARLESKYWNSVSSFGALLHFQYHSCEEIVYYSMDSKPELTQYILYAEVTANQHSERHFHCARLESKYWYSVSTFRALLHFQDHSCEEIVYFSMDFSTAFIHNIQYTEVTSDQPVLYQCFHYACKTWIDVLKFSIHFRGTSSLSGPQLWRDSLLFKEY